jgi:hypothetical protein
MMNDKTNHGQGLLFPPAIVSLTYFLFLCFSFWSFLFSCLCGTLLFLCHVYFSSLDVICWCSLHFVLFSILLFLFFASDFKVEVESSHVSVLDGFAVDPLPTWLRIGREVSSNARRRRFPFPRYAVVFPLSPSYTSLFPFRCRSSSPEICFSLFFPLVLFFFCFHSAWVLRDSFSIAAMLYRSTFVTDVWRGVESRKVLATLYWIIPRTVRKQVRAFYTKDVDAFHRIVVRKNNIPG